MTATDMPPSRRRSRVWLVSVLVSVQLVWFGVVMTPGSVPVAQPTSRASNFVLADGSRFETTFTQDTLTAPAMVEDARIQGLNISDAMSGAAARALDAPTEGLAAASWWREAVVPAALDQPSRYRIRSIGTAGVFLRVQDWENLGVTFQNLLELPADVASDRTWSSSGRALARPTDWQLHYINTSSSSAPTDAGRAAQGCLQVTSKTALTSDDGHSTALKETNLWCPGAGVIESRGTFGTATYEVRPVATPSPDLTLDDVTPQPFRPVDLSRWTVREQSLFNGDPTFGGDDIDGATSTFLISVVASVAAVAAALVLGWRGWRKAGLLVMAFGAMYGAATTFDRLHLVTTTEAMIFAVSLAAVVLIVVFAVRQRLTLERQVALAGVLLLTVVFQYRDAITEPLTAVISLTGVSAALLGGWSALDLSQIETVGDTFLGFPLVMAVLFAGLSVAIRGRDVRTWSRTAAPFLGSNA